MKEDEIRSAIKEMNQETLADALTIVLAAEYLPTSSAIAMNKLEFFNFAQAIQYLKETYDFTELDTFTTEADLVYVQTGERRILLTDRMKAESSINSNNKKEQKDHSLFDTESERFSHLEL
jgi:hypothetical protein